MRLTYERLPNGRWEATAILRKHGICYMTRQLGDTRAQASWNAVRFLAWGDPDLYVRVP